VLWFAGVAIARPLPDSVLEHQISDFVRRIHQDHRGHVWFGTNGDEVMWMGF